MKLTKLFGKNKDTNVLVVLGVVALVVFLMKYNKDKNGASLGMRNLSSAELESDVAEC